MTGRIIQARVAPTPTHSSLFSAQQVRSANDVQTVYFDTLTARRSETDQTGYDARFLTIPNCRVIVTGREIFYLTEDDHYFPSYYPKPWVYQEHLRPGEVIEIDCTGLPEYEMPITTFAPFLVAGNWFHTLLDNYVRMYFFDFLEMPSMGIITPFWALRLEPPFRDDRRLVNAIFMQSRQQIILQEGIYHFNSVILPPLGNQNDYIACKPLDFVATKLSESLLLKPAFHRPRLFISRADIHVRNIANESELMEALRPLGITAICPGDYSFRTQLELFASAELLLGVHGQGFTPMICARDCQRVMELEAANWTFTAYRSIASCLGIPYEKLPCSLVEHRDPRRFDWLARADIPACVAQIEAAIASC
jgi:hypothetical protein